MKRTEYICDICGKAIPKGAAVLGFEFASATARVPGDRDTFDYTFSDYHRLERHWCGPCLRGVAAMAPGALSTLNTIGGGRG